MRIPRIYTPQALSISGEIILEEQASTHLAKVLRFRENDVICLFNGQGGEYSASISAINKKTVNVIIHQFSNTNHQSRLYSEVAVSVSKGDKMDFIVQKCTELGVNSIIPLVTERSDVKLDAERWQKKIDHWQQVSISACEQSGRNLLPEIQTIHSLNQWLEKPQNTIRCLFHPTGTSKLSSIKIDSAISMAFGCEGGFSANEVTQAEKAGCHIVGLGNRVLRAETAPLAAMAIAQTLWGDF